MDDLGADMQKGDGEAAITRQEQIGLTVQYINGFCS